MLSEEYGDVFSRVKAVEYVVLALSQVRSSRGGEMQLKSTSTWFTGWYWCMQRTVCFLT